MKNVNLQLEVFNLQFSISCSLSCNGIGPGSVPGWRPRALQLDRQLVESSGWKSYLLSPEQLAAQQADDETRR
ncbi:hypothetical protein [Planctomycetes bacterium TBK1r]|uniref:hypothetical protein n=1 Tax=Stieleria magnilauensis TaxID=2527963 RepID=UPI0011A15AF7